MMMNFFKFKQKKGLSLVALLFIVILVAGGLIWRTVKQQQTATRQRIERQRAAAQASSAAQQESSKKTPMVKNEPTIVKSAALDNYFTKNGFIGSVLIVKNNQIVLEKGYGYANAAQKRSNTPSSVFLIGSTEKALVATSILQLKEQGKLNLDDPIGKYYANFPNGQKIKLRNLLTHTSGLRGRAETFAEKTPAELLQEISNNGINTQPGQWHYMDDNYVVLANLVEKLSGQSLREYLQRHIFRPSGLQHTGFADENFFKRSDAANGYLKQHYLTDTQTERLPAFSQLYGVGDIYMDPGDMYRFDQALTSGKLISKEDLQTMWTPGSSSKYGMGFYNDPGLIINRGYLSGFSISNGFSHDKKNFIVLFSNVKDSNLSLGLLNGHILALLNAA
ncbi:serine hydrolase domain-containing protein [Liquorilactobacillus satsumensis]|uniref:Beta-lactamase family protein n=2 Tax=Liquorilactobacillus satsumensis TaxID=259059 RepID=A0A0R1UUL6_9LACO|nr:beta-lactamase family protein [Liquorilactobacillus satsumensis DSM 16230 = JCM 12392]